MAGLLLHRRLRTASLAPLSVLTQERATPRTLIEPRKGDRRFVRRKKGKFTSKQVNVGRSLAADRCSKSKTIAKQGEGDRGD
jgi:hypothetical protein